jgi:ubiquinone/menaquinone biosynthesis C-methylase UbiE
MQLFGRDCVASVRATLHDSIVASRRNDALARAIERFVPQSARVLDVGCGDGRLALRLTALRPDISVTGVDIEARAGAATAVRTFDGRVLPFGDRSADIVLFCDVLHHVDDASGLLLEAKRVGAQGIVLKDHFAQSAADTALLAFMDRVGNPNSVRQPHNYLSEQQWLELWHRLGLAPAEPITRALALYPPPFSWLFDRHLHFVAHLSASS